MFWFLFVLIALYLLIVIGVAACFVFPFRTPIFLSPGFLGTPQETVEFPDEGTGKLIRAWWVPKDDPKVVMVCGHGFMMNRAELSPFAPRFKDSSIAFLFYDFPAHGSSHGRKSGFGYRERTAVRSASHLARQRYPNAKIILLGGSMGAAASAFALSEDPTLAEGLILDSCYDRFADAIAGWWLFIGGRFLRLFLWPSVFIGGPMTGVNPFKIVVSHALERIDKPTLVLHGSADSLATVDAAEANFAALKGPKKLVIFEGRNHSEARWEEPERYFNEIEEYLATHSFLV